MVVKRTFYEKHINNIIK